MSDPNADAKKNAPTANLTVQQDDHAAASKAPKVAPPPARRPPRALGQSVFETLPELPDVRAAPAKRNLTLVAMLQVAPKALSMRGWRLAAVGCLILAVAIATTVMLQKQQLLAHLATPQKADAPVATSALQTKVVLTPQQQAAQYLNQGIEAYRTRDYGHAVSLLEQALNLDPSLAAAHRSLGIVHAKLHDESEAMVHYKKYLEMAPQAPDAADVKKILDDYQAAHPPAVPAAEPPLVKPKDKSNRKRRAHHLRHHAHSEP